MASATVADISVTILMSNASLNETRSDNASVVHTLIIAVAGGCAVVVVAVVILNYCYCNSDLSKELHGKSHNTASLTQEESSRHLNDLREYFQESLGHGVGIEGTNTGADCSEISIVGIALKKHYKKHPTLGKTLPGLFRDMLGLFPETVKEHLVVCQH